MRNRSIGRAARVAVACSAPTKPQPPPAPHARFSAWQGVAWHPTCVGGVVNDGSATAYTAWVSTSVHEETALVHAVAPESLAPGEKGTFTAVGERVALFGIVPPRIVDVGWQATPAAVPDVAHERSCPSMIARHVLVRAAVIPSSIREGVRSCNRKS